MSERQIWVYYATRDSVNCVLSDNCSLWWVKPLRSKHASRVTWIASSPLDPGHFGEYPVEEIESWFRTTPSTDLEMVKVEQWAPA